MIILMSACLLGTACRYDGNSQTNMDALALLKQHTVIPICPELFGGLPTPREPSERQGDRVVSKSGTDVTAEYHRGAAEALRLAKLYGCQLAVLKDRSPSCGCGFIYDGSFSGTLTDGDGITAELLKRNGIQVVGESILRDGNLDRLLEEKS